MVGCGEENSTDGIFFFIAKFPRFYADNSEGDDEKESGENNCDSTSTKLV
jgi:hypothetical protein